MTNEQSDYGFYGVMDQNQQGAAVPVAVYSLAVIVMVLNFLNLQLRMFKMA